MKLNYYDFDAVIKNFESLVTDEMIQLAEIRKKHIVNSITDVGAVDTGNLRGSFIVESPKSKVAIVGTNVKYAPWVNNGHTQVERFVPGEWNGDRFTYIPNHSTGMKLTSKRIAGKRYIEQARHKAVKEEQTHLKAFIEGLLEGTGGYKSNK